MSTLNELRNGIISDMARENEEGITAAVDNAISLSIRHYETQPWWFLETQANFVTVNGTEYYDLPSDFGTTEVSIVININNNTYPLIKRHYTYLEDVYTAGTIFSGYPSDYAVFQQQIRLYPVPNGAYTATLSYVQKLGIPASDGASNAWTEDCEPMIRARAEWQLYSLRYHDLEAATVTKQVETDSLTALRRQHGQRVSTGATRKRRL